MRRLSPDELSDTIDELCDEAERFHPWHEPGVTATEPIPLDERLERDGSNRAYAELRIEGEAPDPAAITVDETHLAIESENGVTLTLRLDETSVIVRSWTRLRIENDGNRFDLEFQPGDETSAVRSRKAMAAALAAITTVGLGGVGAMAASTQQQFRLAFRRFPMLYRHLERNAASFRPMSWRHPKRVLYTVLGSASSLIFLLAIPVFLLLGHAVPTGIAALIAGPRVRDGLQLSDVPIVVVTSFLAIALSALIQAASVAGAAIHLPMFIRALTGRASPAERPTVSAIEYGNRRTGGFGLYEFGKVNPSSLLLVTPVVMTTATITDVVRQGEIGIVTGATGVVYYGGLGLAIVTAAVYAWRIMLRSRSALLNKLLWVHDHRDREQTVLHWENAKLVIAVGIVTALSMLAIPPLFAP